MENLNKNLLSEMETERLLEYLIAIQEQIGRLSVFQSNIIEALNDGKRTEKTEGL